MKKLSIVLGWVWALPTTLIWLLWASLGAKPSHFVGPEKAWVWHVYGGPVLWLFNKWPKFKIGAQTAGTIIIAMPECDPRLIPHERGHVWQSFVLGILYLPVYALGCVYGLVVHGDAYNGNPLERLAVKFGATHQ